jgi:predicted unusual protein kinase regulating ubiquinone biosynthesis (AarF/ABC1/UbiB family)
MEGALSRFSEAIVAQTDLLEEAHNLNRFLEQLGLEDPDGRVPVPIFALSSSKFLVMQWLDGEPLDRAASTRSTEECVRLVESYLRVIERMVLRDGLLHGDLHPGNVLLGTDGRLVLLDAGIAVPLTEEMMSSCNRSVTRYLRRDWAGCAKLMYDESPSTSSDSPEQAVAKKTRLTHELSALEKDEWKGLVDFWGRLMRAFERSGVATDRAFDALGVALLGADALVRNLPQGEQVLFDHLARLRKDPDALAAILHKNPRASNHT